MQGVQQFRKQTGFSLVEIMVGVLVGMLSILVIMKMASIFGDQKNTTSSNADAQENGMMAMMLMETALRSAGANLPYPDVLQCGSNKIYGAFNGTSLLGKITPASFVAVSIVDGGTAGGNSDQVSLPVVLDTNQATTPPTVGGMVPTELTAAMASETDALAVSRTFSFFKNNLILVIDSAGAGSRNCSLMQITNSAANAFAAIGKGVAIQHATTSPYNPGNVTGWPKHSKGSLVFSLGVIGTTALRTAVYKIENNTLFLREYPFGSLVPVAASGEVSREIVNMQAQYGIGSAAKPNVVASWVNATGTWANPTGTDAQRIAAIRLTIVARSGKMENADVTAACAGNPNGPCTWVDSAAPLINLSHISNWKRYRYRVYQTVVPLRNVIWAGS